MSDDPILAELRAVTINAKAAADAAKSIAPLPKTVADLSTRLSALEASVRGANLGSAGSDLRTATAEAKETAQRLQDALVGAAGLTRPRALLAVLGVVFFVAVGGAAWAGISPALRAWGWLSTPGLSQDQAALLHWAESDTGQWAQRFATTNGYIHTEGCPKSATGMDQQSGRKTCVVWLVQ